MNTQNNDMNTVIRAFIEKTTKEDVITLRYNYINSKETIFASDNDIHKVCKFLLNTKQHQIIQVKKSHAGNIKATFNKLERKINNVVLATKGDGDDFRRMYVVFYTTKEKEKTIYLILGGDGRFFATDYKAAVLYYAIHNAKVHLLKQYEIREICLD